MLENLEIGEAAPVAPEKLNRRQEELPGKIRDAFDLTPVGEARQLQITVKGDAEKIGGAILRLLKNYAKSKGFVAFKASATVADSGERDGARTVTLYWHKKTARQPRPAIEPRPSEPITTKPKKEKGGGAA